MCFSATASFTSGVILLVTGGLTLGQVKSKRSLPFASIPLIFGIQQIIEGMVWLTFGSTTTVHQVFVLLFVFIAYVFWPMFVPITIALIEKSSVRRKLLWTISAL